MHEVAAPSGYAVATDIVTEERVTCNMVEDGVDYVEFTDSYNNNHQVQIFVYFGILAIKQVKPIL